MAPPIVYGITQSPPVRAVLLTARAAGVKVEFKEVNLNALQHFNADYLKINPAHTIPSLDDNGFVIWESRAVMTYLVDKYGGESSQHLYPKDVQKRAAVDNMLHFDNGSLWAAIRRAFFGPVLSGDMSPAGAIENFYDKLSTLNEILSSKSFVAGDELSVADISILCGLTFPAVCGFGYDNFPHVKCWMAKVISELPFYDEVTSDGLKTLRNTYQNNWKKLQPKLL